MLTMRSFSLAAVAVAMSVALSFSPAAFAAGNAEAGATKAATCLACHGMGGNSSNPEWPSLAGQNAAYTADQLSMFRKNHRQNELMMPMAMILTDEDVLDIAAYYASLTPTGLEADATNWKAGEVLYKAGDAKRNIPACKACHGPVGRGNPGAGYPAVRAQHAVYTVKQLNAYAADQRYTDVEGKVVKSRNGHMMVTIAKRLTAEDMQSLASYIQGMR